MAKPKKQPAPEAAPPREIFPLSLDRDYVLTIRSKDPHDLGRYGAQKHRMATVTKALRAFAGSRNGDWFTYERKHTCDGQPEVILGLHESKANAWEVIDCKEVA